MICYLLFYIIPAIIAFLCLPKFIEYNGGKEYVKSTWDEEWKDCYYARIMAVLIFTPVLNFIIAFFSLLWYVRENIK